MKVIGTILSVLGVIGIAGSFINPIESPWDEKIAAYIIELIMIITGIYLIKKSKTKNPRR